MRPPTVTPVDSGSMLASSTVQGASETGNKDTKVNDPHENILLAAVAGNKKVIHFMHMPSKYQIEIPQKKNNKTTKRHQTDFICIITFISLCG